MTIYADENFYASEYLAGKKAVITAAYTYYFREASRIIDVYTFGNVSAEDVPDEVRMCCCELAEQICAYDAEQEDSNGKSAESVQGWSVTYASAAEKKAQLDSRQRDIICKWLSGTGLLYSGVR
ncbi:MAG: hypothetical protein J6M17_10345 [Ruminococcus sp.]|nr:hypothetical protein [Ruminococcus sp.]